jgi:hypothetical protein
VDILYDCAKAREKERADAERVQASNELDATIRDYLLATNGQVKLLAKNTQVHFIENGKRVDNMVCVATNLATGTRTVGRAGHKISYGELEAMIKDHFGVTLKISHTPATAYAVSNTVNCAEWQALRKLLQKEKPPKPRGEEPSTYSQIYFAAAVPGNKGGSFRHARTASG